jgi:large subunit ribosomal protein L27
MAHTKAGGSTRQKGNRKGKHLGVKVTHGQSVEPGMILIRQKGQTYVAGTGSKLGRDFTIFSTKTGKIEFKTRLGKKHVQVTA